MNALRRTMLSLPAWLFLGLVAAAVAIAAEDVRGISGQQRSQAGRTTGPSPRPRQALEEFRRRGDLQGEYDYLQRARSDPELPAEFKQTIEYRLGVFFASYAAQAVEAPRRAKLLSVAEAEFRTFLANHPTHPLASDAHWKLAKVLTNRTAGPAVSEDVQEQWRAEARREFEAIDKTLAMRHEQLAAALEQLPKYVDPRDTRLAARQLELRTTYTKVDLKRATAVYNVAWTYEPGSGARALKLREAAEAFHDLGDKYMSYLAAYHARMCEARCYKDLGETQRALGILDRLLELPDEMSAFREFKDRVRVEILATHLANATTADHRKAVIRIRQWEESPPRHNGEEFPLWRDPSSATTQALSYLAGEAYLRLARQQDPTDPLAQQYRAAAEAHLARAAAHPGLYQRRAKAALHAIKNNTPPPNAEVISAIPLPDLEP